MTPLSQLGSLLASVKCPVLVLRNMELSEENTRALVTAMRTRVQDVTLSDVTLDLELLAAYDGQGHCTQLELGDDTTVKYLARLRQWAGDRGWTVTLDNGLWLAMERK